MKKKFFFDYLLSEKNIISNGNACLKSVITTVSKTVQFLKSYQVNLKSIIILTPTFKKSENSPERTRISNLKFGT